MTVPETGGADVRAFQIEFRLREGGPALLQIRLRVGDGGAGDGDLRLGRLDQRDVAIEFGGGDVSVGDEGLAPLELAAGLAECRGGTDQFGLAALDVRARHRHVRAILLDPGLEGPRVDARHEVAGRDGVVEVRVQLRDLARELGADDDGVQRAQRAGRDHDAFDVAGLDRGEGVLELLGGRGEGIQRPAARRREDDDADEGRSRFHCHRVYGTRGGFRRAVRGFAGSAM